ISSSPWNAGPTSRSARRASTPRPEGAPISGYGAARGFVRHRHARHAPHPETGRPMNDVTPAPALTQREVLLHALYEAAELEHNLMCTYLYAAASLKDGEREGLGVEEAAAVRRWRQVLLGVAIEEMGHLAAVWNITSGLGGSPRFGRSNFPLDPGLLPASVVVKLAPFNADTLQHFVFLERPHGSAEPEGGGFAYERSYVRGGTSGARLTPLGVNYDTVGDLYAARGARVAREPGRGGHRGSRQRLLRADAAPACLCLRGARPERGKIPCRGSCDRSHAGGHAARRPRGAAAGGAVESAMQCGHVVHHAARLRRAAAGTGRAAPVRRALRTAARGGRGAARPRRCPRGGRRGPAGLARVQGQPGLRSDGGRGERSVPSPAAGRSDWGGARGGRGSCGGGRRRRGLPPRPGLDPHR